MATSFLSFLLLTAFSTAAIAAPPRHHNLTVKCPVIFDGRIPRNATLKTFDTTASPYSPDYVKGVNTTWSSILLLPNVSNSLFDTPAYKPLEVTISDASLFLPGGGKVQYGFRRAGLLLAANNGTDASNEGVVTFHWSVGQDRKRGMNLTHEYMNVWHETNDYSHNQFSFKAGEVLFVNNTWPRHSWKMTNSNDTVIWHTPIVEGAWQNFAVHLDYGMNTIRIYYSKNRDPLVAVTPILPNDNSGGGQFQIGMAKKPTETQTVVYDGYQEHMPPYGEGQIYGGIFIEDSANGCISGYEAAQGPGRRKYHPGQHHHW